ncbi:uncharacterized protein SEPMUDRAFT_121324 [Sphaerulina musiva SO2202]|uniref:DUF7918 domain-containing protein n=1 Tax=Sphaerulina musiva (strain SO2202) TaxID=692275 RepID=M3ASR6_SPHMS|nr:uncharacterized protein SEPMUDRAFT_121324 [Sphaerulina musiva SO2202]EMF08549.1 hypothetical protein SEPMUDRAFT_121324 [Sphaerulina musiva SO2202]
MAIHPDLPEIPVSIKSAGKVLPEYEDHHATPDRDNLAPKRIIRYIEIPEARNAAPPAADPGADAEEVALKEECTFEIHADVHGLTAESYAGHCGLFFSIWIDGEEADSLFINDRVIKNESEDGELCMSRGQYTSNGTVLPFCFKPIKMIHAAAAPAAAARRARSEAEKEKLERLGTIRISVWYMNSPGIVAPATIKSGDRTITGLDEIDLKGRAVSHTVGFGEAMPLEYEMIWGSSSKDLAAGEVAVWEFRCRSREALKQERIILETPNPSPEPNEVDDKDTDLTDLTREQPMAMVMQSRKRDRQTNQFKTKVKNQISEESQSQAQADRAPLIARKDADTILCINDDGEGVHDEPHPKRTRRANAAPAVKNLEDDDEEEEEEEGQTPGIPRSLADEAAFWDQ